MKNKRIPYFYGLFNADGNQPLCAANGEAFVYWKLAEAKRVAKLVQAELNKSYPKAKVKVFTFKSPKCYGE